MNFIQEVDYRLLQNCIVEETAEVPEFYPQEFERLAQYILLRDLNIAIVNIQNALECYLHLISTI